MRCRSGRGREVSAPTPRFQLHQTRIELAAHGCGQGNQTRAEQTQCARFGNRRHLGSSEMDTAFVIGRPLIGKGVNGLVVVPVIATPFHNVPAIVPERSKT